MSSQQSANYRQRSQRGSSIQRQKKRYKYCCRKCKHTQGGRKSCVCVVPKTQRRTQIGVQGCQTCGCNGCSVQDYIARGEDPQYKPKNYRQIQKKQEQKFDPKNGCCRKCMKAFSKTGKSCLCQVPQAVRKTRLSGQGCKICGCNGCNPRDHSISGSPNSSERHDRSISSERPIIDKKSMNLDNIDNSVLGKVILIQYNLFPGMLGMGVPQRTPSYILGRPI